MAQRNIDFGAFPDDPDADAIRSAFEKVQLNFTEVFAGLGDQAVVSVNKTAGPGVYLVNGSPVGNVVLGANIACVQFSSTTLSVGRSPGTGPGTATITDSTQTLYIDLPNSIANITDVVVSGNVQGNTVIGNLSGDFGYVLANTSSGNGNIDANNITLTGAVAASNVSGNGAGLSALVGSNITGQVGNALVSGTVYTNAQPNITSVGTLTTLDVQSTITAPAFTANTGLFTGDGGGLSNIVAANVSGTVATATTAGTVTTNAQPNITQVGTLTSLAVTGFLSAGLSADLGNSVTANYFLGNGSSLSSITGANVSGEVAFAATANSVAGGNISGEVAFAAVANSVAGANVSGEVAFAQVANSVAGANVTGEVAFASTANSVAGSNVSGVVANATHATSADSANAVAGSNVTGEVSFAATANAVAGSNVSGEVAFAAIANSIAGANVTGEVAFAATANAVAGANVSGTVANATHASTANTVVDAVQSNITTVGTLSSLDVSGNISGGNVTTTGVFTGDGGGLSNISVSTGSYIENGTSEARLDTNGPFRVTIGGTANVLQVNNSGTEVAVTGSMSVSGGFDNNIDFNSTSNLGPVSNVTVTGGVNGAFLMTDGSGTLTWDTATLVPAQGSDTEIIFNDGGTTYAGNAGFTFNKTSGNLNAPGHIIAGSGLSAPIVAGSLTTNAQPNITSVGTLTGLILSGNLNTTSDLITNAGNITIASGSGSFIGNGAGLTNITGANVSEVPLATLATTATTANAVAGANVTGEVPFAQVANSVAGANVSGEVDFAGTANSVAGSNVSGAVSTATVATTVSGAAQSNITSVGTLSSLSVTGNVSAGNVSGTGGVFTYVSGDGANLTAIDGQQVTGEVDFAQVANSVAGANVSGTVALATSATSATTSGTVTTSAQPNITSVGTLSVLGVNGIVTAQSFTANTGLFTGDGGGLSNVVAANISGIVANSTYATSAGSAALALDITGATQPNITSVGTLTSLTVSGNITNQTHIIKDVTTVTASGTTQGSAAALSGADIFSVTTPSNDNGVRLMNATPGLCIYIKNLDATDTLKVYPATNDAIDGNGTNGAMSISPLGQIQFVAHSSSQWYTVGATYA